MRATRSSTFRPILVLAGALALLVGCAVQDAASGFGDEEEDATTGVEDGSLPTFDLPTVDPDTGSKSPDTGTTQTDPDTGSTELDTGTVSRPDSGLVGEPDTGIVSRPDVGIPASDTGTMSGSCAGASSCATCTAMTTCGWCALTARCMDGTATGPSGGASCAVGWAWVASSCTAVDPCNAATSCGACAAQAGCGWCGGSNRCVTANTARTGPASGTCASAWAGSVPACTAPPVDPCNAHTECGGCTDDARCGWCRSTRRCQTGVSMGPNTGTCDSWAYINSACATPGDPCGSSHGCGSCTDRGSCGWCDDSNTCHTGSSSGPSDGACARSSWTWSNFFGFCL